MAGSVLGMATTAVVWLMAGAVASDRRAAPLAALCYAAGIFGFFGQTVATPDAPLTLFSTMALLFLVRALQRGAASDWLLFGPAIGLAFDSCCLYFLECCSISALC